MNTENLGLSWWSWPRLTSALDFRKADPTQHEAELEKRTIDALTGLALVSSHLLADIGFRKSVRASTLRHEVWRNARYEIVITVGAACVKVSKIS